MFELALALTAVCLLLFVSAYVAAKGRDMRGAAFSFVTALLAATEALDYALLHYSGGQAGLLKAAALAESLLPAAFALFSLGYARTSSIGSLPLHWRAFLLSTALF